MFLNFVGQVLLRASVLHKSDYCREDICVGIVTDLINALLGNGSVNTVQHATIEQRGYATRF
jgi:hypothetical protein